MKTRSEQIANLSPNLFSIGFSQPGMDEIVKQRFHSVFWQLVDAGMHKYDQDRLSSAIFHYIPLLHKLGVFGKEKTAVEIGSGLGTKALSWAPFFNRYIGIEIDQDLVRFASTYQKAIGLDNLEFISANAIEVFDQAPAYGFPEQIDVLILFAVLEHLTPDELRMIFKIARAVLEKGGDVLVAETPNRLIPFDSHGSHLHFFNLLPDQVAIDYANRSPREDLRNRMLKAPEDKKWESLYRIIGRGISYHDFELYLLDTENLNAPIIADGYDVGLLNLNPFLKNELILNNYFKNNNLAVHRSFSRSWLELILRGGNATRGPTRLHYLEPALHKRMRLVKQDDFWSLPMYYAGGWRRELRFHIDENIYRSMSHATVLIDASNSAGSVAIFSGSELVFEAAIDQLVMARPPIWHSQVAVGIDVSHLQGPELTLRCGTASSVVCSVGLLISSD